MNCKRTEKASKYAVLIYLIILYENGVQKGV